MYHSAYRLSFLICPLCLNSRSIPPTHTHKQARRQLQLASAAFAADAYRSYAYNGASAAFAPHFDDRAAMQRYRTMLVNDVSRAQVLHCTAFCC